MYLAFNELEELAPEIENELLPIYRNLEDTALVNHNKVLTAFQQERVSDYHLKGSSGYGYNDMGREVLEKLYARVFGAQAGIKLF